MSTFQYQAVHCSVYAAYLELLGIDVNAIVHIKDIPHLPIDCFKHHLVKTGEWQEEILFQSSGTGGIRSRHAIPSLVDYQSKCIQLFESRFGKLDQYALLALLPNYLEQGDSSLVAMVDGFMQLTSQDLSGYFLDDFDKLAKRMQLCRNLNQPLILFGVTYAMLDFAHTHPMDLPSSSLVIETGGMKGRKLEMTRSEVHDMIKKSFKIPVVYSEYGMTELLSQAYTDGSEWFAPGDGMSVSIRPIDDPFGSPVYSQSGLIQIIDLHNEYSCSFIQTADIGVAKKDGQFRVLGRLDYADQRGCNLLYVT